MNRRFLFLLGLVLLVLSLRAPAQGTAFSYQGRLSDAGSPANGAYDIRFGIYDAVTNGTRFGPWLTNSSTAVSNGLFMVTLDFGTNIFNGTNWWLDLGVRTAGGGSFTALFPRQPVLPVPYAIFAITASNVLGAVSAGQVSGVSTNPVTFTNANNIFSGNGAGLTSLNGSQITTGTVPDARLSTNVALLNTNQTFTGTNIFTGNNQFTGANNFTNTGNRFTGSFFGNGNVGWDAFPGPTVQAQFNHGYLLTNAQFTTVQLPPTSVATDSTNIGYIVRISGGGAGGWRLGQAVGQSVIGNFYSYQSSLWYPSSQGAGEWYSLAASTDGSRMYAAGSLGLFASADAGHGWAGSVLAGSWSGVANSADGKTVMAVTTAKSMQVSVNAGASGTWSPVSSVLASNCVAVACSADATKAIVAGNNGSVYTNNPSTGNWFITGATGDNNVVAYAGSGNNYAAGNISGSVFTLLAGSKSLTNKPITGLVISTDGSKLAACARPGGIYISMNGGVTWTNTTAPLTNWGCLAASADCTRLFAGVSNGVIYTSVNFGANWTALVGATNTVWSAIACSADGTMLVGGASVSGAGIFYSSAGVQAGTITNSIVSGSQRSAVELQYIGNGQFMPVSSAGNLWAN